MAEATKKMTKVLVNTVTLEERVELILTTKEAEVLLAILNNIGGKPDGVRGLADGMSRAIRKAGINWVDFEFTQGGGGANSIYFEPNMEYLNG